MFDRAKAEALSRHVVAVIKHTDFPGVMTVVFDKAARADWMAFDVRHFPDVMVGNEWYQTAGSIGKKALGFDISVHPEDMKRAEEARTAPTLHLDHAPSNLYQFFMEKVRAGSVAHFAFAACDAAARQAAHDAIDAKCSGEAVPAQQPWAERVQAPARSGQRTLMIVEDDDDKLVLFTRVAEAKGWQVVSVLAHDETYSGTLSKAVRERFSHVAKNLSEVEALIRTYTADGAPVKLDAVLTDYQLGICEGTEVVAAAKRIAPGLPVVAHSSDLNRFQSGAWHIDQRHALHNADALEAAFKQAGADAVLSKKIYADANDYTGRDNAEVRMRTLGRLVREARKGTETGVGM